MSRKFVVFLTAIITLNLLIFHLSSLSTSSSSTYSSDNLKLSTNLQNATVLRHGVPQTQLFTNESTQHNWILKTVDPGQIVYFSILPQPPFSKSDFQVTLYDPLGFQAVLDPKRIDPFPSEKYLASWIASRTGNWSIQVNDTREEKSIDFSYEILASTPIMGYSVESAISLSESFMVANLTVDHEIQYWKVSLDENQNCTVFLKESTSNVLNEAEITIYSKELGKGNPVAVEEKHSEALGLYNLSWNPPEHDDYIIEISHKTQYTGLYNISSSVQQNLYNFLTAGRLPHNQTIFACEVHNYVFQKYYFWFMVNTSRSEVNIRAYAENPTINKILDLAQIEIYDRGLQDPIHTAHEYHSTQDGKINITMLLDEGKYYLVIYPQTETKGLFYIHFEYRLPKPFIWTLPSILLSIITLGALPVYLIFLDSKGKWFRVNQWTIPTSLQDSYTYFKNNLRGIFNIKEVPNESILIRVTNIPFKTFGLLNFLESSETETLVISKRIQRKIEWIFYFFTGFLIFDVLNILGYYLVSAHILPFYIPNPTVLFVLLAIPTGLLTIAVIIVNVATFISYSQIINRLSYVVENYQEESRPELPPRILDPNQALKNINYVRVLWNQAKHAFKENNFELFVIKADASVKNLLSTRFQQIISEPIDSKPDFQFQVASLRKRGFDLPSERKIARFRNLRNRIVHSSITLDEKESVDCFAYYSTFISRLGLRSS
ncbi:MAG: hypothetical protein JSU57_06320 [Candidatus Heimdallarchaeota archaeon]|nr:MAG: hypothetical protein JSU57_06320 [Candidatus Heimdallarchaeota archaeon]